MLDMSNRSMILADAISSFRLGQVIPCIPVPWLDCSQGAASQQSPRPCSAPATRGYVVDKLSYIFSHGLCFLLGCGVGWRVRRPALRKIKHLRRRLARWCHDPISLLPSAPQVHRWPSLLCPRWAPRACRLPFLRRAATWSGDSVVKGRRKQGGAALGSSTYTSSACSSFGRRDAEFTDEWQSLPTLIYSWREGRVRDKGMQDTLRARLPYPHSLLLLQKEAFDILYDPKARTPVWCGFFLRPDALAAARHRRRPLRFIADQSLPSTCRTRVRAMRRRGFDKGHLAPHASVAATAQASLEANQLSNVILQDRNVNRGVWKVLEHMSRDYVRLLSTTAAPPRSPKGHGGQETRWRRWRLVLGRQPASPPSSLRRSREGHCSHRPTRRAGLALQRLMREQTPFAECTLSAPPARARGLAWLLPIRRRRRNAQLAVVTGPLFYPKTESDQGDAKPVRRCTCAVRSSMTATPRVADAVFMALWDVQTHLHIAFIVPNCITGSKRAMCSPPTIAMIRSGGCVADAAVEAVRRFVVPMERLELAFAASLDELQGIKASPTGEAAGQTSCIFFPLLRRRWRARTWLARLRARVRLSR